MVSKLGFLTDFMVRLNNLNFELQGKCVIIIKLLNSMKCFKSKLKLINSQLKEIIIKIHFQT